MKTQIKQIRELTPAAQAAKLIRGILKAKFSTIKFRVTSSNFSMGDSIDVSWTDGFTSEEVMNEISQFKYGHFDGMTDCYEYSNSRKDIPQTKFLSCDRTLSEEAIRKFAKEYMKKYNMTAPTEDLTVSFEVHDGFWNWHQLAWRELSEVNLEVVE